FAQCFHRQKMSDRCKLSQSCLPSAVQLFGCVVVTCFSISEYRRVSLIRNMNVSYLNTLARDPVTGKTRKLAVVVISAGANRKQWHSLPVRRRFCSVQPDR